MKISRLKDSRGVSFMELLGILTVLGVMIAATSGIVLRVVRDQTRQQFYNQILNLGDSFRNSLSDNRAWRETVQKNGSLACFKNVADCSGGGGTFTPYDSTGALTFNGYDPVANPKAGFDVHGNACTSYDATKPDGRCVARLAFRWTPLNCTGACVNPEVQITFDLEFAIPEGSSLLPYPKIDNYRPAPLFRAGSQVVTPAGQMCNPKQVLVGFDKDGNIQCANSKDIPPPAPPCTCASKGGCTCDPKTNKCSCAGQCGKSCP